ncbi:MAG: diacylglycerol kinase [Frankiales bacterium]|nr:diacylglycerol kinase [Frankiales bacterium]
MRALFVVNPNATTTGSADSAELAKTLGAAVDLTVRPTERRDHATQLAESAAQDGVSLVIAHGGDGTVNEIVNGLMRVPAEDRPMFAVVPGGYGNVFSRALGQPIEPAEVAARLVHAIRAGVTRRISLGDVGGRFFTFAAGFGFDARVVRQVDLGRKAGRSATTPQYVAATLREYMRSTPWRRAPLTLITPSGMMTPGLHLLIVANTTPWTYLGDQPLHACPDASFDTGLDILGLRRFGPATLAQTFAQVLTAATPRHRHIVRLHDLDGVSVHSHLPISVQLDGEYAGEVATATLHAHRQALTVIPGVVPLD